MSLHSHYSRRLQALTDFCLQEYSVSHLDLHYLCSLLIPSESPVWSVLETPYTGFWHDLTHLPGTSPLQQPPFDACNLSKRARYANRFIDAALLTRNTPLLVLDHVAATPRKYPGVNHRAPALMTKLLRWNMGGGALRVSRPGVKEELGRLVEEVVDSTGRMYGPSPVQANPQFSNLITLLAMLNPEYSDPYALTLNLSYLPSAHCCLVGREKLEEEDWMLTLRAMQGSVREWTQRILAEFVEKDGAHRIDMLPETTKLSSAVVRAEVGRLAEIGVLEWAGGRHVWVERGAEWWMETEGLVGGSVRWWK